MTLFRSLVPLLACVSVAQAQFPAFAATSRVPPAKGEQTAVLAGGCFWGVDAVFKHVKGVKAVFSGYSGGPAAMAEYEKVSTGRTGHAGTLQNTYHPSQISFRQRLKIFFSVAHQPTEL